MKKTPVMKALTHYYNKCDSLSTTVNFFISFVSVCVRACVRAFVRSFVHSLRYSMSVNYLKILLDKFMVLIISMSPGIIRRCLIILSADRQQSR